MAYLKSWRDVVTPRQEVLTGTLSASEFMADLAQVAEGNGTVEYGDPVEFFSRTYLTGGLNKLLQAALKRLTDGSGNPVVQLKTSFGGGKTHSMLALYHLFSGKNLVERSEPVQKILREAGVAILPNTVNVAVFVGTRKDVTTAKKIGNISVNTIWGDIIAQIVQAAGKPELYEKIRASDENATSPGVDKLREIFDECGACLILIDELVAYGRKVSGGRKTSAAGTFGNLMTFVQELTEAAKVSKRTMVVATLPDSEKEIGDEAGGELLEKIEHTFGRLEAVWQPVTADEGFKIVSRRLFIGKIDEAAREETCAAFSKMYDENPADFPADAKTVSYKQRLIDCYPIHPEIFARLYNDWSTLDKFQKTRGVLRFMAAVIYNLWNSGDKNCMIMAGSISPAVPEIKNEIMKYLPNWSAVIDSEVDGANSVAYRLDNETQRLGKLTAAKRVARTIFLGSAPSVREQHLRGVEDKQIRLGIVTPDDSDAISIFNNALSKLREESSYLYANDSTKRFWYDTRPTLAKLMKEIADRLNPDEVDKEIDKRLKEWRSRACYDSVYITDKSGAVPDEQVVRLVILPPEVKDVQATARDILDNRGGVPRQHKNTLLFMAATPNGLSILRETVRKYIAWNKIKRSSEVKNLDKLQTREVEGGIRLTDSDFKIHLSQAYSRILAPKVSSPDDVNNIIWDEYPIKRMDGNNVNESVEIFKHNETFVDKWNIIELTETLEWLAKGRDGNSIAFGQLWEYFTDYLYMKRLYNVEVLESVVRAGVIEGKFGLAESFNDSKYTNLKFGEVVDRISPSMLIVNVEVAKEQRDSEKIDLKPPAKTVPNIRHVDEVDVPPSEPPIDLPPPLPTKFFMNVEIDSKDFKKIDDEIISQLLVLDGAKVKINLRVEVEVASGIDEDTKEIVSANCDSLGVKNFSFRT